MKDETLVYTKDPKREQDGIFVKAIDHALIERQCARFKKMRRQASENMELPLVRARKPVAQRDETQRPPLKVAGLFAGIGGIELGLARAGHESNILCEFEPGARAVLEARFPETRKHDDIRTLSSLPRDTELVAAGFPCQDLSQAGKTVGIEGARSGLVGEVFRLLESRRVPWVLLENVPFMLQLARGQAMAVIVDEMERLGYRSLRCPETLSSRLFSGY